jgi:serine/threonine protein kinase
MGADATAQEQFGPYLVYERLGVGGMATVHRALERGIEGFERVVALKRLLPHLAADASFIKSFVREAKLASLLNHVNIVQIFELGRVGTVYFISMEHIDGRDIRRILRHARKVSGPPPIHVTVGLLLQLCDALDYAHHKVDDSGHPLGLVHRDVSPSNVLVTSAGQVKVIDFGIAKAQSVQLRTQTGRVKGKLAYMAPEVLAGKDLDARSDLFAAGIIGHELLTARPLFTTRNEYETLMKVQRGEIVPPSTFNQTCPPELDAIVLRALARDPDERFLHASDMRDELHALRKQYNLQTADRDIAMWLEWAFSLEAPNGAFTASHTFDHSNSAVDAVMAARRHQPAPRRGEEDESIDIAWGEEHNHGAPVLLDDVPDVSDKHLESASALGAEVRLDLDDLVDDIPAPLPSHGPRPPTPSPAPGRAPTTATASLLVGPVSRTKRPTPAMPTRQLAPAKPIRATRATKAPASAGTRNAQHSIATPNVGVGVGVRNELMPPRVRTITIPPLGSSTSAASRTVPSLSPPPPAVPVAAPQLPPTPASGVPAMSSPPPQATPSGPMPRGGASLALSHGSSPMTTLPLGARSLFTPARDVPSGATPSRRSADAAPPRVVPTGSTPPLARNARLPSTGGDGDLMPSDPDTLPTVPPRLLGTSDGIPRPDQMVTEPTPAFAMEDLDLGSDTILSLPQMPVMHSADSFDAMMQFHAPTPVPPAADAREAPPAPTPPSTSSAPEAPSTPVPTAAPSRPTPIPTTQAGPRPRLITPATALFAEPEPDAEASHSRTIAIASHKPELPPDEAIDTNPAPPRPRTVRRALVVLAVIVLIGAVLTAAALYLTRDRDRPAEVQVPPRPATTTTTGTVTFIVTPTDSTIAIDEGKQAHHGSPWSIDLVPGIHQIEIQRDGFKAWLTSTEVVAGQSHRLSVPLEPLEAAVLSDATLIVGSAPSGLEAVLDGAPAGKTPIKLSIKVGPHTVVLRRDGADMWKTELDARASAVYEFSPMLAERPAHAARTPAEHGPMPATGAGPTPAAGTGPTPAAGAGPAPTPSARSADPGAPPISAPPPALQAEHAPAATPAVALPPAGAAPLLTIPSTAVSKLSGAPPSITKLSPADLPSEISARLCIDETGHVTSAGMLTMLPPAAGAEIVSALRTWQYTPYRVDGAARAACFGISFRVK